MKIWTCGSSLQSGSRNAWMRIKNINSASRLRNFWNFFSAIQMISCRNWWPWTKPGYITTTQRQSNNQWSGSIAAHPAPKNFTSIFWNQEGILLTDYLPKGQTINAEYYSSLLLQLKVIFKEKRHGKVTKGVLFFHDNAPAHWALATQEKLVYLGFQYLDHPHYSQDLPPSDYHLFPGLKTIIESSPFFVQRGGHCCCGDLVGRTTFWIFLSGLQKLEQWAKKCTELRGEYAE